jgi:hypothetical protein
MTRPWRWWSRQRRSKSAPDMPAASGVRTVELQQSQVRGMNDLATACASGHPRGRAVKAHRGASRTHVYRNDALPCSWRPGGSPQRRNCVVVRMAHGGRCRQRTHLNERAREPGFCQPTARCGLGEAGELNVAHGACSCLLVNASRPAFISFRINEINELIAPVLQGACNRCPGFGTACGDDAVSVTTKHQPRIVAGQAQAWTTIVPAMIMS